MKIVFIVIKIFRFGEENVVRKGTLLYQRGCQKVFGTNINPIRFDNKENKH